MYLNTKALDIALANSMMSRTELAKASGVSDSTLCKAVNDKTDMRPKSVGKIAKALGVSVESIILDGEEVERRE